MISIDNIKSYLSKVKLMVTVRNIMEFNNRICALHSIALCGNKETNEGGLRRGQAVSNFAYTRISPRAAGSLTGGEFDCFHDDYKISIYISKLVEEFKRLNGF